MLLLLLLLSPTSPSTFSLPPLVRPPWAWAGQWARAARAIVMAAVVTDSGGKSDSAALGRGGSATLGPRKAMVTRVMVLANLRATDPAVLPSAPGEAMAMAGGLMLRMRKSCFPTSFGYPPRKILIFIDI
uniref:Secreted protein n=1 Tax=Oryza meridionalis TaxID=40149 RepID=A0A0E0ELM5_9ORYZ